MPQAEATRDEAQGYALAAAEWAQLASDAVAKHQPFMMRRGLLSRTIGLPSTPGERWNAERVAAGIEPMSAEEAGYFAAEMDELDTGEEDEYLSNSDVAQVLMEHMSYAEKRDLLAKLGVIVWVWPRKPEGTADAA